MLGSIATLYFCHYSSRYFQTDSHQSVSACLAFFEAACHILMCNLAFLVHLGNPVFVRKTVTVDSSKPCSFIPVM